MIKSSTSKGKAIRSIFAMAALLLASAEGPALADDTLAPPPTGQSQPAAPTQQDPLPQDCDGVAADPLPAVMQDKAIIVGKLEANDDDAQGQSSSLVQPNGDVTAVPPSCDDYAKQHDVRILVDTADLQQAMKHKYLVVQFGNAGQPAATGTAMPYFDYQGPFAAQDASDQDNGLSHSVTEISISQPLTPAALKAVNDAQGFILHLTPSP
jgi:hypothetical protein